MVKLTVSLISQRASQNRLGRKGEKKDDVTALDSVTHIKLHDSFIHEIGDISQCLNLTVLYLHNNCIERIDNLQHASNLTHLYLQKNRIAKMENLSGLQKLRKLYLGQNYITVLEGLERLTKLEELHIEKQNMPPGEALYFDPRTISSLSACLRLLNTAGNGLASIGDLAALGQLRSLCAQDNCLDDICDICDTLKQWPFITSIAVQGNPVAKQRKYKENIIVSSPPSLVCIDGKDVTETTRTFLKRLERRKASRPAARDPCGPREAAVASSLAGLAKQLPVGVRHSLAQAGLTSSGVLGSFPPNMAAVSTSKRSARQADSKKTIKTPRPFLRHTQVGRGDTGNQQLHSKDTPDLLHL
ncbi:protein phosphatase 1 regulatory subunit 42-like isoform X2 [Bacillus rossius redtenbacheri]|uniref:protein phosphatase 1 regulatory subunit 42-like isoform X2 n=1 Tax=Bacillus rossius redtenbacheri TaxID=93214 RepID=UPI002FDE8AC6